MPQWTGVRDTLCTLQRELNAKKCAQDHKIEPPSAIESVMTGHPVESRPALKNRMVEQDEVMRLETEVQELRRQQAKSEEIAQAKSRIMRHRECTIAQKEEELLQIVHEAQSSQAKAEEELDRVKRELQEAREEVQEARSRSASASSMPEAFRIPGRESPQEEQSLSRSAPESSAFSLMHDDSIDTSSMIDILATQVETLQAKMEDQVRRTSQCSVCMAKPFVWVYKCGHAKCDDCAIQLQKRGSKCPECRGNLEDPRRLFWATCG